MDYLDQRVVQNLPLEKAVLFLDRRRCPFSKSLYQELVVMNNKKGTRTLQIVDLGTHDRDALRDTWLPGVPCLVESQQIHLGIDAFTKCREYARSLEGVHIISTP